jgi:hypothetical protein
MIEIRRPVIAKLPMSRKLEVDDGIAEDVRKIKESMKEQQKSTAQQSTSAGRKPRQQAKAEKIIAPKAVKARTSKRSIKVAEDESNLTPEPEVKKEEFKEEFDEAKLKLNEKLKKELLADWMEEDDLPEKEKNGEKINNILK